MTGGSLVQELDSYMESMNIVDGERDVCHDDDDVWGDESPLDGSDELNRELQKRRQEFYNMGYLEGAADGNRDAAQEGFNKGFKESVHLGYRWGLVRGVTSALAYLPDQTREKIVDTEAKRREFDYLSKSVNSLSTEDALKLFYNELQLKNLAEQGKSNNLHDQESDGSFLENLFGRLEALVTASPSISLHDDIEK